MRPRTIQNILISLLCLTAFGCAADSFGQANVADSPFTAWPLQLQTPSGVLEIYQPQPEKLTGNELSSRAAVSLTPPGATDPIFGAIWVKSQISTDTDARTVTIDSVSVRHIKVGTVTADQEQQFIAAIQDQFPALRITFSLDQLMTSLALADREKVDAGQLETTPPKIIFAQTPTILVTIDGPPKLAPVDQSNILHVINTPYILLQDPSSNVYFLSIGDLWMSAPEVSGPWTAAAAVPQPVAAAASTLEGPPPPATSEPAQPAGPPQVIVVEQPTELVVTNGPPQFVPIVGNDLLYASNTTSDLFQENNQFFLLLSGRWYQGPALNGPWTYVAADKLPPEFAKIPPDSPKADVLAFVAGTTQAEEAKLDAGIPQTSVISRDAVADLNVIYDGDPQFASIEGTPMTYAVNTPYSVIELNGTNYCCDQAVWYEASTPQGPWGICTAVPQEIYAMPPSCPLYNCRYCYVYDVYGDSVCTGYLPGYTGCYVFGPTVIYGTGFYYSGFLGNTYIPRPCTWGFAAQYDPWTCSWGFDLGFNWGRPKFIGGPWRHDWWGPTGYRDYRRIKEFHVNEKSPGAAHFQDIRPTRLNIYNRAENVRRNAPQARMVRPLNPIPSQHENNVYVGHDGSVYRNNGSTWEKYDNHNWTPTKEVPGERPALTPPPRPATPPPARAEVRQPVARAPVERPPVQRPPVVNRPPPPAPINRGLENDRAARQSGAVRSQNIGGSAGGRGEQHK